MSDEDRLESYNYMKIPTHYKNWFNNKKNYKATTSFKKLVF
jgi:hypothetical protein